METLQALLMEVTNLQKTELLKYWRTATAPFLVDPSRLKFHEMYQHKDEVADQVAVDILFDTKVGWKENMEDWLKTACKAFSRRGMCRAKMCVRNVIYKRGGNDQASNARIAPLHPTVAHRNDLGHQLQPENRTVIKTELIEIDDEEDEGDSRVKIEKEISVCLHEIPDANKKSTPVKAVTDDTGPKARREPKVGKEPVDQDSSRVQNGETQENGLIAGLVDDALDDSEIERKKAKLKRLTEEIEEEERIRTLKRQRRALEEEIEGAERKNGKK